MTIPSFSYNTQCYTVVKIGDCWITKLNLIQEDRWKSMHPYYHPFYLYVWNSQTNILHWINLSISKDRVTFDLEWDIFISWHTTNISLFLSIITQQFHHHFTIKNQFKEISHRSKIIVAFNGWKKKMLNRECFSCSIKLITKQV